MTFWHRLFPCVLCGALAAMALGRPVWAQSLTSGALQGIVRDAAGTPLSGARITVTGAETGVSRVEALSACTFSEAPRRSALSAHQ